MDSRMEYYIRLFEKIDSTRAEISGEIEQGCFTATISGDHEPELESAFECMHKACEQLTEAKEEIRKLIKKE